MKKLLAIVIAVASFAAWSTQAADGKALWEQHCAKCHGKDGKGETAMGKKVGAKDYSSAKVQEALTDSAASKAITDGFKTPEGKQVMKATEGLSADDVKALVAHLRSLKK